MNATEGTHPIDCPHHAVQRGFTCFRGEVLCATGTMAVVSAGASVTIELQPNGVPSVEINRGSLAVRVAGEQTDSMELTVPVVVKMKSPR